MATGTQARTPRKPATRPARPSSHLKQVLRRAERLSPRKELPGLFTSGAFVMGRSDWLRERSMLALMAER